MDPIFWWICNNSIGTNLVSMFDVRFAAFAHPLECTFYK